MSILVTGSRGHLGKIVCKLLEQQGYHVVGTRRPEQVETDKEEVVLRVFENIDCRDFRIDAVIHLASTYSPLGIKSDDLELYHSNVGSATSVARLISNLEIPVVVAGTYFEKCNPAQHPWSPYAASKEAGKILLKAATTKSKTQMTYLYLYDNYGFNTGRGKFVDLMLDSISSGKVIEASSGRQSMNLTHEDDVALAIVGALEDLWNSRDSFNEYQISSKETFSLRELVEIVNSVLGSGLVVEWGKLKDREKEVYQVWDSAPLLPNWSPRTNFKNFLELNFENFM